MSRYALIPVDGRKSFYNKAIVTDYNGTKTLTSYATDVAKIDIQGNFIKLWGGYSATTMRHINAFRIENGLQAISKKEWLEIPHNITPFEKAQAYEGTLYR